MMSCMVIKFRYKNKDYVIEIKKGCFLTALFFYNQNFIKYKLEKSLVFIRLISIL